MLQINDREFVTPGGVTLRFDGCEVSVTPIVVAEVFDLLALVEPIYDELALMDSAAFGDKVAVAQLLVRAGEPLLHALAMCTRVHFELGDGSESQRKRVAGVEHQQWVNGLLLDRAAELLATVVEVNRDFFERAMPRLRELPRRLGVADKPAEPVQGAATASAGETPSSP